MDTSYGVGGAARVGFDLGGDNYDVPTALATTSDGKILVAGTASTTSGSAAVIAKLGVDGMLDSTFGANHDGRAVLPFDGQIGSLSEFSDRTIVYAGTVGSTAVVGRITPTGLVDTSFNTTGYRLVASTAFLDSGNGAGFFKVLEWTGGLPTAVGYASSGSGTDPGYCVAIMRFNSTGSTDTSFGFGVGNICVAPPRTTPYMVGVDAVRTSQGKLVFTGGGFHSGGSGADFVVGQILSNGAMDTEFGSAHDGWSYAAFDVGGSLNDGSRSIAIDSAGRLVVAGGYSTTNSNTGWGIARFDSTGNLDSQFGIGGIDILSFVGSGNTILEKVIVQPDGRLLINGSLSSTPQTLGLVNTDGSLVQQFGLQGISPLVSPTNVSLSSASNSQELMVQLSDFIYVHGTWNPGATSGEDIAVARYVVPLFSDGFEVPKEN